VAKIDIKYSYMGAGSGRASILARFLDFDFSLGNLTDLWLGHSITKLSCSQRGNFEERTGKTIFIMFNLIKSLTSCVMLLYLQYPNGSPAFQMHRAYGNSSDKTSQGSQVLHPLGHNHYT